MTNNAEVPETRWHSSEYVDSWLADQAKQATYRPAQEKLISLLPFQPDSIINILDIGSGDGALSLMALSTYPGAQVVCLDSSEVMLSRARQRLAQFSKRVKFVKSDLRDPAWIHGIKETFDAVVSSITIHDVDESIDGSQNHPSRAPGIYREIFSLLKPGGVFLDYDFFIDNDYIAPPDSTLRKIYRKARLAAYQYSLKAELGIEKSLQELEQEFQEKNGQRSESSHEQAGRGLQGIHVILNQLEWLEQAGFDEVDCLWKDTRNTIIGGFNH